LCWDNVSSGIYESLRAQPSIVDASPLFDGRTPAPQPPKNRSLRFYVPTAKRRQLSKRELAERPIYAPSDQNWLIPDALFPAGITSKPGDVWVELPQNASDLLEQTGGTRWTVLQVDWLKFHTVRRLTCRNLVLELGLADSISVERPAIRYDAAGVPVKQFPSDPVNPGGVVLYESVPASVDLISKEMAEQYGIRGLQASYQVIVGQELDVTGEDRVLLSNGLYLDIVGYQHAQRIDQLPFIVAERRV
jgi:hypothetical protein